MQVKTYLKEDLEQFPWDRVKCGNRLKDFYLPLTQANTRQYIHNSNQKIALANVNGTLIPLSYAEGNHAKNNTYLLSFLAQYFDYAKEEVLNQGKYSALQKFIAKFLIGTLRQIGNWMGMDNVVFVNNLVLSTNLYPSLTSAEVNALVQSLKKSFPKKTIVFRTLNEETNQATIACLEKEGAIKITCRQVYILPNEPQKFRKKRAFVRDKKLWEQTDRFEWIQKTEFSEKELNTILYFYKELYVKKYSIYNPDYTKTMIQNSAISGVLRYYLLIEKETKAVKAVQAVAVKNGEITTPFIGYDPNEPQETGLYRFMNLQLMELAISENLRLNMSSGAAQFKMQRGGKPTFDNHLVVCNHLPYHRRIIWHLIHLISERMVRPTLQKMKL